jgi:opacity protein-like surface antigen
MRMSTMAASAAFVLQGAIAMAGPAPAGNSPRVFIDGAAGGAVDSGGGVFAGGASAVLTPHLQLRGEFGRMTNVMPASTQAAIDAAASAAMLDGSTVTVDAKTPANYGAGTVRALSRSFKRVTPFAEGGGGFAHLSTDVSSLTSGVDVTPGLLTAAGVTESETKPLLLVGGGITVATSRRSAIDVGYRYDRIFTDTAIGSNKLLASMRVGF